MVTRRELGFVLGGGAIAAAGGYLVDSGQLQTVASPLETSFPTSGEFVSVTWERDGWITIQTETEAKGESIALAPGDVEDPLAADNVGSNISERGATVEFGLGELIRKREFATMSLGSYRLRESGGAAEALDVVRFSVPKSVRDSVA